MRNAAILLALACAGFGQAVQSSELLRRAIAAQERGDLAGAVRDYQEALRLRPDLAQARTNMAAALAEMGRFDEAIEAYRTAIALAPGNAEIRKNLALAYYSKGDAAAAAREYMTLHQARPKDDRVTVLLAECRLRTGEPAAALSLIEPLAKSRPGDLDLAYLRGMALIRNGRPEEGVDFVERVAKQGGSADAYLLAGATQLNLGRLGPARENLEKAVQLNENLPGVLSWAGLARDRAGDEEGAKKLFHQALEKNPGDFDGNLHLGAVLYREKEYGEAKKFIEQALRIDPASPMAQYAEALIQAATGDAAGAVPALERIVRESPNWIEPRVKLSSLYFKLRRDAEGERERAMVDKLNAEHQGKSSPFEK